MFETFVLVPRSILHFFSRSDIIPGFHGILIRGWPFGSYSGHYEKVADIIPGCHRILIRGRRFGSYSGGASDLNPTSPNREGEAGRGEDSFRFARSKTGPGGDGQFPEWIKLDL